MADRFEIDSTDLRRLEADLGRAADGMTMQVRGVLAKGALNIKDAIRDDFRASTYFNKVAYDVNYTERTEADAVEFEIGPRIGLGKGHQGGLAGIAVEGGIRGGGGTVRDPAEALADELPAINEHINKLLDGIL